MFADDTCIHVSGACYGNVLSTLQLSADEVFNWATNNFMTIHPQETKYMIILRGKNIKEFHFLMDPLQLTNTPLNVSVT